MMKKFYDYIIIDCMPSLGMITINGVINNLPEVRGKNKPSLKDQLKDMKNKFSKSDVKNKEDKEMGL